MSGKASEQVVITGAGMATALGLSKDQTWEAVRAGRCGIGPLTAVESPVDPNRGGGQAPELPADFHPDEPREVRYLKHAVLEALRDAGVTDALPYAPRRCGLMLGTTLHGMRAAGRFLRSGDHEPLRDFLAAATASKAAGALGLDGFAATTCSACSSGLGAIALAVTLLQSGQFDLVVAGGYDTLSEYAYGGFSSLRLVAEGPLRPFARDRQGMKLAEGYGIIVLERAADAERRGANVLARVLGFGESADAHHLTQPHPQGEGASRAIAAALDSAGVAPADVGLIAAHATATPDNDAGEYAALSRVFGDALAGVPVVGLKSHLGHTLGGAGAVELILAALAMRDGLVPPCPNSRAQDVEFPNLHLNCGEARPASIRATLSTSLGFGGANTCVILGRPNQPTPTRHALPAPPAAPARRDVLITGIGVVLPSAVGNQAFADRLNARGPALTQDAGGVDEGEFASLLNLRRVRRVSDYVKLSLGATALACEDAGIRDVPAFAATCAAVLGSAHGSARYSGDYYQQIVAEGVGAANPMLFAEGVPNAAAAHLSLMLSLKGACQTVIGSRTAGLDALRLAALRVSTGQCDRVVVSAAEEFAPLINDAYRHCGLHAGRDAGAPFGPDRGFASGAGAVTLVLESPESAEARGARPRGLVRSASGANVPPRRAAAALREALTEIGQPRFVVSSANGTWLDRAEAAALGRDGPRVVSSLAGHFAECFSVGPLAAIAAVLLTGRLPRLLGAPGDAAGFDAATGEEQVESFGVLCTDYTGLVSAARVTRVAGQN